MKGLKFYALGLVAALLLQSCGMSNTTKGALIGGSSAAALGAALGGIIAKNNKGQWAAIGGAAGAVAGTAAGAIIGNKMDKAKKAAEEIENAQVETVTDGNGYQAVKLTFDSGILFDSGKSTLRAVAQNTLSKFANNVLKQNTDMNVGILGYTDNQGFKSAKTAAESKQMNVQLSQDRAQSVCNYLLGQGISSSQIKEVVGFGEDNPVASNETAEGRQQNRRVEVYLYASEAMIKAAQEAIAK
ncbi:MAG: OmpA family protein [Bacteroidaceae bacterium]|nr:OmpA family protein [Bacteroidaceae bacterium]MBR1799973.1 OmpA family protein [Bacteroidaceae bacterium]